MKAQVSMARDSDGGNSAGDGMSLLKGTHSYRVLSVEGSERQQCIGNVTEVALWCGHALVELREQRPWS